MDGGYRIQGRSTLRTEVPGQGIAAVGTLVMLPIIFGYTIFVYWIFSGKLREGEGYHSGAGGRLRVRRLATKVRTPTSATRGQTKVLAVHRFGYPINPKICVSNHSQRPIHGTTARHGDPPCCCCRKEDNVPQ
jgi:hypothetical protein